MKARYDIYGLADPHLGLSVGHSMARFSAFWADHPLDLLRSWARVVGPQDLVLCPGDLSVATNADHVVYDLMHLDALPGSKVVSPGNHDRGIWDTQAKARKALAGLPSVTAIKGQAERFPGLDGGPGMVMVAVCGHLSPGDHWFGRSDKALDIKRFERETHRLALALERARDLRRDGDALVVMVHYPPFANENEANAFTELIDAADADLCVYGHIHQEEQWARAFQGQRGRCAYRLLAADYLRMTPRKLGYFDADGLHVDAGSAR